jgi:hypothetical protein
MSRHDDTIQTDAIDVFDQEFLTIRAKLLEVAASLDRIRRGAGTVEDDPRMMSVQRAIGVLAAEQPERAEQIQLIFSRDYDDQWQDKLLPAK